MMTKTQVWPVTGSSHAVAPDTTGTFESGFIDLSQAWTSTHLVVCSRIAKLFPRQHVSALESDTVHLQKKCDWNNQVTALASWDSLKKAIRRIGRNTLTTKICNDILPTGAFLTRILD